MATVAAADNPTNVVATVTGVDAASGAITLDGAIEIDANELLKHGQPVTALRVVLDPATVDDVAAISAPVLVNEVGAGVNDQDVPAGTEVVGFDSVTSNILELNQPVTVSTADNLGFGFVGTDVVLDDIAGIDIGEEVGGPGVPAGTTVVDTTTNNGTLPPNTIVLSAAVNVEDAAQLIFGEQGFAVLSAPDVSGAVILPESISGVIYDGNQAIQTFTSNRDGTLNLTSVGSPVSRVTTGEIDYETGLISLGFNTPPRDVIELRDVAFESANVPGKSWFSSCCTRSR